MTNYIDKGRLLLQQKEYTKALEFFQAAIEIEESPKEAYLGLAEVYFALQKDKQGREALFKALALDPYNEQGISMAQEHCFAQGTVVETKDVPHLDQIAKQPVGVANTKYTIIPPNINHTPYYAMGFNDGNMIYLEKNSDGYTIVAPNRQEYLRGRFYNNWDGYKKPQGKLCIPELVSINGETLPITEIGNCAFCHCELDNVIIPNTIVSIGLEAFLQNEGIRELYIPNSVKTIKRSAFRYCSSLSKVHLSEKLELIDEYVLGDTKITTIDIPALVNTIIVNAFAQDRHSYPKMPSKMIMHGLPPKLKIGEFDRGFFFVKETEAYIPKAYMEEYKFSQFWQEMELIPY